MRTARIDDGQQAPPPAARRGVHQVARRVAYVADGKKKEHAAGL
jgi:hypothetical protein